MKRLLILTISLALIAALPALAEADPAARFAGAWQDPLYGRAMLRIAPDGEGYDAKLTWGDSASSEGVWRMSARYDGEADTLVYENGVMAYVTYGTGGEVLSEEIQWEDATGRFALADGKLLWTDSREERSTDFAFERVPALTPSAEALKECFYLPVAEQEFGTAGASLKLAQTAAELLSLVDEYRLWDTDLPALRENLLAARSMLDETALRRFDESFPAVIALMDAAFSDYDSVAGQFGDAGAEYMAYFVRDEDLRLGWEALVSCASDAADQALE